MDAGNSTGPFGGSLKVTPINWVGGSVQLDLISFVSDQFVFRHFSNFQIYVGGRADIWVLQTPNDLSASTTPVLDVATNR